MFFFSKKKTHVDNCAYLQKTKDINVWKELFEMHEVNSNLQKRITDLMSRSMRDNLLFSNTEKILQTSIKRKSALTMALSEREHQMVKWCEHHLYPRNVVAKFIYFKNRERERELIRTRPPMN